MLPVVIDLFSGCGGLALGFSKAGFNIAGGIELMPEAVETLTDNFCWRYGMKQQTHICGDITTMKPDIFKDVISSEGCIVIGGPPCQAYSLAGKAKLRSLGDDRENTKDKRGYLYQDFLRFVKGLNARAVVMENVPESVNYGDKNIPQIVCEKLEKMNYTAFWTILNAADYGVPQIRERVFIIGIKNNENKKIHIPKPLKSNPRGELSQYQKRGMTFSKYPNFRYPLVNKDLEPWTTVGDALSDLPVLFPDVNSKYKLLPMNVSLKYRSEPMNEYQRMMRNWYGEETDSVTSNAFRKTIRDFPIFADMKQGDNFLDACEIAETHFKEKAAFYRYEDGSEDYLKLRKMMVPPYSKDKFKEKWKRLSDDKPSHTLVAHLSVDTYSHIHPWEPRGISVREAARIQSFPDDFFFDCSMGDAFKQIGNAVPPLLSYAIAKEIRTTFEENE